MRLLIILVFSLGLNLGAQDHPIGIKFGGNLSNLSGDGTDDISSSINFQAGLFSEITMSEKFVLQPELLFSVYGFEVGSGDFYENPNVRLNYVILPVIARFFVSETFCFDAGPQVGLLVTAKNGTGSLADVKTAFNDKDYGVNLGMGLEITEVAAVSLRYYLGLADVSADENLNNKNRSLQLALQFKIN